jgi:hypothetical protein
MEVKDVTAFAANACSVIDACCTFISEQQATIDSLRKSASACKTPAAEPAPAFSAETLQKAANAVFSFYGEPANLNPASIVDYWKSKPESVLSTIEKMASVHAARTAATAAEIGHRIPKKASAPEQQLSADEMFRKQYSDGSF